MGAKVIAVSADDSTYYTLPGNTGNISLDGTAIDDTVFGQFFKSNQPGLINWKITSQAWYKGFAGYTAIISQSGTPTTLTSEATTMINAHNYQITTAARRVLDPATAVVVKDGITNVNAQVKSIDYLSGTITFLLSYTVVGAITVSGKYLPMTQLAKGNAFTLTETGDAVDITVYEDAQSNGGFNEFQPGLLTAGLEVKGFYDTTQAWRTALAARALYVITVDPAGTWPTSGSIAKGFFKLTSDAHSGNVGVPEDETLKFDLYVVDPNLTPFMLAPFAWYHSASTLSMAVQTVLAALLAQALIYVKYLPDGVAGVKGQAVVTNATLTNGINAMNSFAADFQMTGAPTTV